MLAIVSDIEKKIQELDTLIKIQGEDIERYRKDIEKIREMLSESTLR